MDEPGCVSNAWLGEGSCRIQPDRARLQSQAGAQSRRAHRVDGRPGGLKGSCLSVSDKLLDNIAESHSVGLVFLAGPGCRPIVSIVVPRYWLISLLSPRRRFPHGLQDLLLEALAAELLVEQASTGKIERLIRRIENHKRKHGSGLVISEPSDSR